MRWLRSGLQKFPPAGSAKRSLSCGKFGAAGWIDEPEERCFGTGFLLSLLRRLRPVDNTIKYRGVVLEADGPAARI